MRKLIAMNGHYHFFCPGCNELHSPDAGWQFTGTFENPTLSPSVFVKSGHFVDGNKDSCWCAFNAERREKGESESGFSCGQCHSFIENGKIRFLNDCTHTLAGQTVDLPCVVASDGQVRKAE